MDGVKVFKNSQINLVNPLKLFRNLQIDKISVDKNGILV